MTREQFETLLKRREELQSDHQLACEVLEELAAERANTSYQFRKCQRLYDQIAEIQAQIDAEIAAERAAGEA